MPAHRLTWQSNLQCSNHFCCRDHSSSSAAPASRSGSLAAAGRGTGLAGLNGLAGLEPPPDLAAVGAAAAAAGAGAAPLPPPLLAGSAAAVGIAIEAAAEGTEDPEAAFLSPSRSSSARAPRSLQPGKVRQWGTQVVHKRALQQGERMR